MKQFFVKLAILMKNYKVIFNSVNIFLLITFKEVLLNIIYLG